MSSGRSQEVINKVVAVAQERCSFTRGSNHRIFTGKNLVFWIGGRLWEVVVPTWGFDCIWFIPNTCFLELVLG